MSIAKTPRTPARQAAPRRVGLVWLTLLAILQVALLVWVVMTVARPRTVAPGPLLSADMTTVTKVTVDDPDGSSVALAKVDGDWVLPAADNYPADGTRVQTLLDKIGGLQRNGLVATNASSYARLKVADDTYVRKVALGFGDGSTKTIVIGSSPNYGSTHVRLDGDPGVYLVRDLSDTDARADANAWIKQTVTDLAQDDISALELTNANGTFSFHKVGADWVMDGLGAGESLSPNNVTQMVNDVASLRVHEPIGKEAKPEYGFDDPAAVITITSKAPAKAGTGAAGTGTSDAAASAATPPAPAPAAADTAGSTGATAGASTATASSAAATPAASTGPASSTAAAGTSAPASAAPAPAAPASAAAAAAPPVVTTITVGAKDPDGNRYVKVSTSPYVLSVTTTNLDLAADKVRTDFLVKPAKSDTSN